MEIMDSSLGIEIEKITKSGDKKVVYYWRAEIHTPVEIIEAIKVLSIDVDRNYEGNYADESIVKVVLSAGKYSYRIYPYLTQLDIVLYKIPLHEQSDGYDEKRPIEEQRYTATLLNPITPMVDANSINQPDEFSLDITNLLELDFQIVFKAVEQMRMMSFGGVYRNLTVEQFLRVAYTNESRKVDVDLDEKPIGIDIIPPNNTSVRDHILIPQGTKLVDLGQYVHYKCGGVYGSGFACYYQGKHWYVFPPYDNRLFDDADEFLTIINIPYNKMPGIERTYRKDGKNLIILATGESRLKNDSEELILNRGNGLRFADASKFIDEFVAVDNNKAIATRSKVANELKAFERETGKNLVVNSAVKITANFLVEHSKLAPKDGTIIGVTWENSYPDHIFPGMPVKYIYLDGEEVKEVIGVVIKAHHFTSLIAPGVTASRHLSTTNLTIFVKRKLMMG